jgi:redox-sensitive bicupin YhaK (pirin superfamily)
MLKIRKADDRGHFDMGWLDTYHTFSFSEYYDDQWVNFRNLRVMNEDRVAEGMGFGMHPHRDMEIVTIVLSGSLQHKDSMGNSEVILPGEVQRMSAGTGVFHSEFNPSPTEPVHLYQIWILPAKHGVTPSYEQTKFDLDTAKNQLMLVASPDGAKGSVTIGQDVKLYRSKLEKGKSLDLPLAEGRSAWLQVISGDLTVNGEKLVTSDGVGLTQEASIAISANEDSEFLLFDLN